MTARSVTGPGRPYDFDHLWEQASRITGWLTEAQARRLWETASALDDGATIVEIGSHQGRSTVVLAAAVTSRGSVVAIDPFVEGKLFGGQQSRVAFASNLDRLGLTPTVRLIPDYSTKVRPGWSQPVAMLYIDGKHDYWTCSDDLRWVLQLDSGATALVHDAFSSIGVTLAILVHVLPSREIAYVGRDGSLARLEKRPPSVAERFAILAQLPWWLRNVAVKLARRAHLRPLERLLGHQGDFDPY